MRTAQRSFAAGEITPELRGQVQAPAYQMGLAECVNVLTLPHGPLMLRPGFRHAVDWAYPYTQPDPGIVPFVASDTEVFILLFSGAYVTIHDTTGALVTTVATPFEISGASDLHWAQSFDVLTVVQPGRQPVAVRRTGPTTFSVEAWAPNGEAVTGWPGYLTLNLTVDSAGTTPATVPWMVSLEYVLRGEPVERVIGSGVVFFDPSDGTLDFSVTTNDPCVHRLYLFVAGAWKKYFVYDAGDPLFYGQTLTAIQAASSPAVEQERLPPLAWHRPATYTPRAVGYHQQRKWFGGFPSGEDVLNGLKLGTELETVWSNPSLSTDAVSVELATLMYNQIEHLVSMTDLVVLTRSAVFIASGGDATISPTNISVKPRAAIGASPTQAAVTEDAVLFSAARGAHLHEVRYSHEQGGHVVNDISRFAPHLVEGRTVRSMTMQRAPWPILWVVLDNGALLSCTYSPRNQVLAWHRHTVDGGNIKGVAAVPDGVEDSVFLLCRDFTAGGGNPNRIRLLKLAPMLDSRREALRLDRATFRDGGSPLSTLSGLSRFEGETVAIVADGARLPDQTVTGGSVAIDPPASVIAVGIPYEGRVRTLPIVTERGPAAGDGKQRNLREVHLRVAGAVVPKAGPSFAEMVEFPPRFNEHLGDPPEPVNGLASVVVPPAWTDDPELCLRFDEPFPATVLSAAFDIEVAR